MPPAEECEVATILPAASAPLDSVTVTVIDHTSDHRTVIEYDFSPSSTINDMKNFISTDLKIDPLNFDIMSVKQRILPLYTTIESLSNEPKTFYIIKSTLAKVSPEVRANLVANSETSLILHPTANINIGSGSVFGPHLPGIGPSSVSFADWNKKSITGYVGLSNQGATCYMNSLIQTLYMTPEFRAVVYSWDWSSFLAQEKASRLEKSKQEGKDILSSETELLAEIEAKSIPRQLQKLFVRLQLSDQKAVKTKGLTKSFGWSDADAFTQHDVQELCRVLFDALEKSFKGTKNEDFINNLYQGVMKDYVKCKECGQESKRTDFYLDIPLVLRAFGATKSVGSIEEALTAFSQPETLEGDNQYNCEKCSKKVDALKGLALVKLPYLLTLQLKRFDFDYERMERIKLDDRVTFPYLLNMRPYLESEEPDERPIIYELFSVLVHRGSSLAGHYYAFTKSFENDKWFEFNDSIVKEISQEEVETSFGADGYQSGFYGTANAYMLMYRKVEPERNKTAVPKEEIMPELLTMVESENQKLREEEEKEKIEREMCKFKVHYLSQKKTTSVNKSITIAEITAKSLEMYNIGPDDHPTDCIRLRTMYSEGILGDVLQPEKTLNSLGFSSKKRVYLDIKEPGDDFPPTEWNSYRVRVFDPEDRTFKSFVYVFSADTCTIGELKVILEKKFGISKEKQRVTWSTTPPQELVTDETLCSREIRDGAVLYLESTSETENNLDSPPLAFSEIERQQTWITLNFNIPPSQELDQLITVNKDLTLREFREKMQKLVNLPLEEFKISRLSYPSKLEIANDPKRCLETYFPGAGDKIDKVYKVLIEPGRPGNDNELILNLSRFYLQGIPEKNGELFEPMFEFKVTTDMKISEVKELLCEKLKEEKQIEVKPNRMRLRETVALSVGREPFTVYLDHQLIKDLHLRTERVLAFQILDKDEWIELNDLNFFIQRWSANDFKMGERDELVLKQGKVSEDTKAFISQKYGIPTDRLALVRFSNFQVKPLELVDAKWDPTLPIFPNKGDLVYWCDVSETPTALSKEERLKLQKTVCRRAEEKALTIQV